MKYWGSIKKRILMNGEKAYRRGFQQGVLYQVTGELTPRQVKEWLEAGEARGWADPTHPVTGEPHDDYHPRNHFPISWLSEIYRTPSFVGEIARLWEKRYQDGFATGYRASREGIANLEKATLWRYKGSSQLYRNHTHPVTGENTGVRIATIRGMNEMRDIDRLRGLI